MSHMWERIHWANQCQSTSQNQGINKTGTSPAPDQRRPPYKNNQRIQTYLINSSAPVNSPSLNPSCHPWKYRNRSYKWWGSQHSIAWGSIFDSYPVKGTSTKRYGGLPHSHAGKKGHFCYPAGYRFGFYWYYKGSSMDIFTPQNKFQDYLYPNWFYSLMFL